MFIYRNEEFDYLEELKSKMRHKITILLVLACLVTKTRITSHKNQCDLK